MDYYLTFDPDKRYSALEWLGWEQHAENLHSQWYFAFPCELVRPPEWGVLSRWTCSWFAFRNYCRSMSELEAEYEEAIGYYHKEIETIDGVFYSMCNSLVVGFNIPYDDCVKIDKMLFIEANNYKFNVYDWYKSRKQEIVDEYFEEGGK